MTPDGSLTLSGGGVTADGAGAQIDAQAADLLVARLERVPFNPFHMRAAVALSAGTFFDAYDALAIATALTVIFATLHISFVNAGILISSGYVGQFLGALLVGALSERYGRRTMFLAAMALFGLFSLAAALSWDYSSLFWFRLVAGFGLGGEVPVAGALFNEFLQSRTRGWYNTAYQNAYSVGTLLAPLIGFGLLQAVGPALSWRLLFAIGAFPALWAIPCAWMLSESVRWLVGKGRLRQAEAVVVKVEQGATRRGIALPAPAARLRADVAPTRLGELFAGIYRRRTTLVWLQWFLSYFVQLGLLTWLPTLYVRIAHLPPATSLLLTAISSAVQVGLGYGLAATLDRWGRRPLFTLGFAVSAGGALLGWIEVTMLHVASLPALFGTALLILIGCIPSVLGAWTYTPELYPTRIRGWATGAGSSMGRLASIVAPLAVGLLLGHGLGIGAVFLMFALASAAGVVTFLTLGTETKGRVLEELSP